MGITKNSLTLSSQKGLPQGAVKWAENFTSADVSGLEEIKAAEANKTHYITDFFLTCDDADANLVLQDATTTVLGPFLSTVEGIVVDLHFEHAIVLTENQAVNVDGTAGVVAGIIRGYTVNS